MRMATSLKDICGVSVAVWICNKPEMKKEIFSSTVKIILLHRGIRSFCNSNEYLNREWKNGLERVACNVQQNYSPGLKKMIPSHLFPLIGLEMLKWSEFHESHFGLTSEFCRDFLRSSFFTSRGTIDEEKAARELVKESSLDISVQYKIICYYFLADIFPSLWNQSNREPKFNIFRRQVLKMEMSGGFRSLSPESFRKWSREYLQTKTKEPELLLIFAKYLEECKWEVCFSSSEINSIQQWFVIETLRYGFQKKNFHAIKYCLKTICKAELIPIFENKTIAHNDLFFHLISAHERYFKDLSMRHKFNRNNLSYLKDFDIVSDSLVSFFRQSNGEEIKRYLIHFNIVYVVLHKLLLWPYQSLFLDVVDTGCLFSDPERQKDFHTLLRVIIDLIEDPDFGETYNYRRLLREFWIKSPMTFKEKVIDLESDFSVKNDYCIFPRLLNLNNFTLEDECNYFLILQNTTLQRRNAIFEKHGLKIGSTLILKGNLRVSDILLKSLKESELGLLKKKLANEYFIHVVIQEENIDKADEFVKWIVKDDEIENLKQEIFPSVFNTEYIVGLLKSFITQDTNYVPFLSRLLKWFLGTHCKIEEWKRNLVSNDEFAKPFVLKLMNILVFTFETYKCIHISDQILEWVCHSDGNIMDIKYDMLLMSVFDVCVMIERAFQNNERINKNICTYILYLCSNDTGRVNEFLKVYNDKCNSFEDNVCVLCESSRHVILSSDKLFCSSHDIEILSAENRKSKCSSFVKKLTDLLAEQERK